MKRKLLLLIMLVFGSISLQAQIVDDTLTFDSSIGKSSYALDTVTIGQYDWALNQAMQPSSVGTGDLFFGTNAIRMRISGTDTGYVAMTQDKSYGLKSISFYAGRSNFSNDRTGVSPTLSADYSTDQGLTWISVGTADLNGVDSLASYHFDNINITGNVRIRLKIVSGDPSKRINIDSLIFTGYTASTCEDPTNLTLADNGDGTFTASWTAPSVVPADGYGYIYVSHNQTPDLNNAQYTHSTSFTSDSLANGMYDVYLVSACDTLSGDVSDGLLDSVTVFVCPTVSGLTITDNNNGTITITWTAPNPAPANGYGVAVVPAGQTPTISDGHQVATASYTSDSLANGDYDIYVSSICSLSPFTYSAQTIGYATINVVGLSDVENSIVRVYPNPAKDKINIETTVDNGIIQVVDMTGRVISSSVVTSFHTGMDVNALSNGIYQLILTTENGNFKMKFVKE